MKLFVAGGTGAIGRRAAALLAAQGHQVVATARDETGAAMLREAGVTPADVDLFDPSALRAALTGCVAVLRLTTKIPPLVRMRDPTSWRETGRLRIDGARLIIEACIDVGVRTCVHESVSFVYADGGDAWLDETSPVDDAGTVPLRDALEGERVAQRLTDRGGRAIVLRFGGFYASDSSQSLEMAGRARRHRMALVGPSRNWFPSVHVDDAAAAAAAAIDAPAGTYNVTDGNPLRLAEFMALMAEAAAAPRLLRVPGVLGSAVLGATWKYLRRSQRVSSQKFHEATGWTPQVPDARAGWQRIAREWRASSS